MNKNFENLYSSPKSGSIKYENLEEYIKVLSSEVKHQYLDEFLTMDTLASRLDQVILDEKQTTDLILYYKYILKLISLIIDSTIPKSNITYGYNDGIFNLYEVYYNHLEHLVDLVDRLNLSKRSLLIKNAISHMFLHAASITLKYTRHIDDEDKVYEWENKGIKMYEIHIMIAEMEPAFPPDLFKAYNSLAIHFFNKLDQRTVKSIEDPRLMITFERYMHYMFLAITTYFKHAQQIEEIVQEREKARLARRQSAQSVNKPLNETQPHSSSNNPETKELIKEDSGDLVKALDNIVNNLINHSFFGKGTNLMTLLIDLIQPPISLRNKEITHLHYYLLANLLITGLMGCSELICKIKLKYTVQGDGADDEDSNAIALSNEMLDAIQVRSKYVIDYLQLFKVRIDPFSLNPKLRLFISSLEKLDPNMILNMTKALEELEVQHGIELKATLNLLNAYKNIIATFMKKENRRK